MARHPVTCLCGRCAVDGTGDFAMREAFATLGTDRDGRAFDLYRWFVQERDQPARIAPMTEGHIHAT